MSHEIRTPMNAIIGFTELLNDQVKEPKLKAFVKTIQSAGHNLLALINDILDLSKIEAGKFEIEKTPCNPHELFTELGNIFMMKMREKNIDFILDIDPLIPESLILDSTRLRQVLFNLVGNAVKFTEQGFVRLRARTDNEDSIRSTLNLLIDVEDSGIGISEDQQQLVFQEFEQSSGQDIKKYGGTGLGLSISKRLIELMGGEISVKSQPDEGSTFTIKLEAVNIASLVPDHQSASKTIETIPLSFHPAKILVVDDVADNRNLLLANFADTQLMAVEAKNGLEAVELAKQQKFDLILMDIRMPVMDGYQAAKEIKAFSKLPIIALTASVMTDEFERLKSDNFQGYMRKPVLKRDLMKELSRFLPHEEIMDIENIDSEGELGKLSDEELSSLPELLLQLKNLLPQCDRITKSNNITEIQEFSDSIKEIEQHHPIAVVNEFATQLNRYIDCFDIAEISRSVKAYPKLISQLEQIKNENTG
jgi:two-component system sensor histidine kinase EvgS